MMERVYVGIAVLMMVICVPMAGFGQAVPYSWSQDAVTLGGFNVSSTVKFGYQKMAVSLGLPVPYSGIFGLALATSSTLDFKLLDGGVWMGGVDVDVSRGRFSVFGSLEASARKNAGVAMASEPFWAGQHFVSWAGSNLSWVSLGAGAAVGVDDLFDVLAGLKYEKWALRLDHAVDDDGLIQNFQNTYGDRYRGDFEARMVIPYLGVRLRSPYFSGWLSVSPYVLGDVHIPLRYMFIASATVTGFEDARYIFQRNGFWLEAVLRTGGRVTGAFSCNVWCKGSWLQMWGGGNEDYRFDVVNSGTPEHIWSGAGSAPGLYHSTIVALGVDGSLAF